MSYVGMAKVFDFLHATNDVLTERGVELPLPDQVHHHARDAHEHGRAVQVQIIGQDTVQRLYAAAPADEQHIQRLLTANCFGDHVGRGRPRPAHSRAADLHHAGLARRLRTPRSRAHIAANLNVGNTRGRLIDILTQLIPFIGYPRTLNGLNAVDELTNRKD